MRGTTWQRAVKAQSRRRRRVLIRIIININQVPLPTSYYTHRAGLSPSGLPAKETRIM